MRMSPRAGVGRAAGGDDRPCLSPEADWPPCVVLERGAPAGAKALGKRPEAAVPADHARTTVADLEGFDFGSVPETADILRVDQRTVRKRIKDGTIPAVRMGTDWRVPTRWLREQAQAGVAA